jgi:hypothetical protein
MASRQSEPAIFIEIAKGGFGRRALTGQTSLVTAVLEALAAP